MKLSATQKKWIVSSLVTFLGAFVLVVAPQIDTLTIESIKSGALIGLVFTGVRAGVKALAEGFLTWYNSRKK